MTHPAHTSASTDPDRTAAPDRSDPDPDCTDATPRPGRTGGSPADPDDRDRQTFPAEGYESRAYRARAEPMAVWPLRDGRYLVDRKNRTYVVDAERAACTCPDSAIRGARCKHVRRVAIEIDAGLVPAPDERERPCAVCGGSAFVAADARGPALCSRHDHDPGSLVADRETGKLLVVVAATGRRADDARTDEGRLVADYDTNAAYGRHEPVFAARYVDALPTQGSRETDRRPDAAATGHRYLFPASRLRSVDADSTGTDRPTGPTSERRSSPVRVG
jgi:hypothetical protein